MSRLKNKNYPLYDRMPRIKSVADMLALKAERVPEGSAFRFRKGRDQIENKTYADVYKEVSRTAAWIDEKYGKGNHIAIIGENAYEWLIAFFSVLSSGNIAVPIDKELPAREVAALIAKADVTIVFISKTYMDLVEEIEGLQVMTLKSLQDAGAKAAKGTSAANVGAEGSVSADAAADKKEAPTKSPVTDAKDYPLYQPEDQELACIFFTSGTSGVSKGVMLTHGNLAAEINECCSMFDPAASSTLAVLPFHHAFGLNVAILMTYNYEVSIFLNKSLKRVKEDLITAKPQLLMLVPLFVEVFYKQIMDGAKKSGKLGKINKGIRISNLLLKVGIDVRRRLFKEILDVFGGEVTYIICGGAYLDPFYVKTFRNFGIEILNGYGATECSPCVAINRNHYKKDGSVGPVIPGTQVKISPEGEVLFKGTVTMPGYYNDPENTKEALQDGWYATGDLGHVDEDGFLFLTGRKKNLIILSNGENISPEELENDFALDPGVAEVLVYEKDKKIIAEIFPEEAYLGNTDYFEALRKKVNEGRPVYKQVIRVVLRDTEFIKNSSKKIVRYKNIPG